MFQERRVAAPLCEALRVQWRKAPLFPVGGMLRLAYYGLCFRDRNKIQGPGAVKEEMV
jgi:hypothetical protein